MVLETTEGLPRACADDLQSCQRMYRVRWSPVTYDEVLAFSAFDLPGIGLIGMTEVTHALLCHKTDIWKLIIQLSKSIAKPDWTL